MLQSMNSSVDLTIDASLLMGMSEHGKIMIGNKAFEFYDSKKAKNFILIPWQEIDYIAASIMFNKKKINRFVVFTKESGKFIFTTKDNIKTLSMIKKYIDADKLIKSETFFSSIKLGVVAIYKKISKK